MFRLVFGIFSIFGIEHDPRSLRLHVFPGCRFVQHEFLNLDVIQDGNRLFLYFPMHYFLMKSAIIIDLFGEVNTCFVKLQICASQLIHSPGDASVLIEVGVFLLNQTPPAKVTT